MLSYPAKINSYSIKVSNTNTSIRLRGAKEELIGDIQFSTTKSTEEQTKAFINRGGFISVSYPLNLLPSVLVLLQHEELFINENGDFTN